MMTGEFNFEDNFLPDDEDDSGNSVSMVKLLK